MGEGRRGDRYRSVTVVSIIYSQTGCGWIYIAGEIVSMLVFNCGVGCESCRRG